MAGFPHSDTLGSQPVYRLPEAYRRFPRPSSAPDAKASTMRSYTLHPNPRKGLIMVCALQTLTKYYDSKKITSHTPTHDTQPQTRVDARVHYTILKPLPNTTPAHPANRPDTPGRVGSHDETTPTPTHRAGAFAIPGPNNVPAQPHPHTTTPRQSPRPGCVDEREVLMFHP